MILSCFGPLGSFLEMVHVSIVKDNIFIMETLK